MNTILSTENNEIETLLQAILKIYGYDFTNYAKASLKRRLASFLKKCNLDSYTQLQEKIINDRGLFNDLLLELSITVTEMYRDPEFYIAFRNNVVPILKTYPYIKIWHAGCATGEEVYSMAILLHEEGFLSKTMIYATDFNIEALDKARKGIYKAQYVKQYIKNYMQADGKATFSDYYHSQYNAVKLHDFLKKRITFSHHNLVIDQVFGEMNVILCRNVLIYFNQDLQDRVLSLFHNSLCSRGFLCLGAKESLHFSVVNKDFETFCKEKIFRKKK